MKRQEQDPTILFHQSSVDYAISSGDIADAFLVATPELLLPDTTEEQLALNACKQAVELKATLGTLRDRTYDIFADPLPEDIQTISEKRYGSFRLAWDLAAAAQTSGLPVEWYGLADVSDFTKARLPLNTFAVVQHGREPLYKIRLEESLAVYAERLIQLLKSKSTEPDSPFFVEDDAFVIKRGEHKKVVPLHGYHFNRQDNHGTTKQEFLPDMPACEVFMAATVLEQTGLRPAVVRVIPYWMKDREMTARDMLRFLGYDELPVLSVVTGEHGDVEKTIAWSNKPPASLAAVKPIIAERNAHRVSAQVAKRVHDSVFSNHRKLYEKYCHTEIEHNIPPTALLNFDVLSTRVHEYLSRTLPAAPIYEESKVTAENIRQVYNSIFAASDIMGWNYRGVPLAYPSPVCQVMHSQGRNTNDVTYVRIVLSSRPEEDPIQVNYSRQIDLVGHFTFENLPPDVIVRLKNEKNPQEYFREQFMAHPPRTALIEARRAGPKLSRLSHR